MIAMLFALALGVTVELPAQAQVRGTELVLGSIAAVRGEDPAAVARVEAVRLGYAPAPGYSRLLLAERMQREVELQAGGVQVTFAGAPSCRVWPELEPVRGSAIEAAARAELERRFTGKQASFVALAPAADLQVPCGSRPAELRARIEKEDLARGQVSVPVQVLVDGNLWRSAATSWQVELREERWVLARDLEAGATLGADALELRRVAVAAAAGMSADMLLGARLLRSMKAGEEPAGADVARATLVEPGATLILEIKKGGISARVPVQAEEAGARGDRIRVRTLDSQRTLRATIVSRDQVRLDLGQGS